MSIIYRVYSNQGTGGPVDYANPVATTTGLTYIAAPLSPSSDTTFAVRAFDTSSNLEEANTDAQVRVAIDENGLDVSSRPNPPHALSLSPSAGGGCRVAWAYAPSGQSGTPGGFHVYLAQGPIAAGSAPAATVTYIPGQFGYSCDLPGPYAPSTYTASVHSFNAAGDDVGTDVATSVVGLPPGPLLMETIDVTVN